MEINLTPDQKAFVRRAIANGRLHDEQEAVHEALASGKSASDGDWKPRYPSNPRGRRTLGERADQSRTSRCGSW